MQSDITVAVPETVGERHGMFIDRRQPEHKNVDMGLNGPEQLFKAKAKGLHIQGLPAVKATDPSRVIEPHRQKQRLRLLPAQFPSTGPLPFPSS